MSNTQASHKPERCLIVVDETLSPGKASNAAAVVAFTMGQRHSQLVGAPLRKSDGTAMMAANVTAELNGQVWSIGINRPDKRNALNGTMFDALANALRLAQGDVRVHWGGFDFGTISRSEAPTSDVGFPCGPN
ncbi:DUF2000 family protein [Paraburkholderia sp. LEh10]|uniref:DUF2000 family protein n=1 Tax=Paraburkholderia sp. LEh10 TaxID=2821353 RepID=UPI0024735BB4|nr:DUF2000 family protein [Paraburkholderia sp. LEh10]